MKPGSFIAGLLTGAVVGGVIALLYAPKSGKETREDLKQKLEEYGKKVENIKAKASQKSKQVREDLAGKIEDLAKEIDNLSKAV
ncbi:MAG: YtxH domain-containing protein [Bacteroidia bacterium]|nr:YtxH domain-containing protein [Bacteroidia bacterium]